MLHERTKTILRAGIKNFISTGHPITSERLSRDYDFGIKSAMIRSELHDLSTSGYLYQPHTSSGRFPSDKAYRFFASSILENLADNFKNQMTEEVNEILDYLKEGAKKQFVKELSGFIKALSIFYEPETDTIYRSGLNDLFQRFDSITKEDAVDIAKDFEFLSDKLESVRDWWEESSLWPQVFIGKSPITRSRHLSVIVNRISGSAGESFLVIGISPKRTNYEKSLRLFKALSDAPNT